MTMTLPCFLYKAFEAVSFFLSLLRTLSRYILADPRELVGRMRDFAEGLPYDALYVLVMAGFCVAGFLTGTDCLG